MPTTVCAFVCVHVVYLQIHMHDVILVCCESEDVGHSVMSDSLQPHGL